MNIQELETHATARQTIAVEKPAADNQPEPRIVANILTLAPNGRPHQAGTVVTARDGSSYLTTAKGQLRRVDVLRFEGDQVACVAQKRLTRKEQKAAKRLRHR